MGDGADGLAVALARAFTAARGGPVRGSGKWHRSKNLKSEGACAQRHVRSSPVDTTRRPEPIGRRVTIHGVEEGRVPFRKRENMKASLVTRACVLLLTLGGCSAISAIGGGTTTPAAETPDGVDVAAAYAEAMSVVEEQPPEESARARVGHEARMRCERGAQRLISERDPHGYPVYNPQAEIIATRDGNKTLSELHGICTTLWRRLPAIDLATFPAASAHDPELERRLLAALRHGAESSGYDEVWQAVALTTTGWRVVHHERTGVVMGRVRQFVAGARLPDGQCTLRRFEAGQQYDGSGFVDAVNISSLPSGSPARCASFPTP